MPDEHEHLNLKEIQVWLDWCNSPTVSNSAISKEQLLKEEEKIKKIMLIILKGLIEAAKNNTQLLEEFCYAMDPFAKIGELFQQQNVDMTTEVLNFKDKDIIRVIAAYHFARCMNLFKKYDGPAVVQKVLEKKVDNVLKNGGNQIGK